KESSAKQLHGSLNREIQSLKLEVERLSQNGPSISPVVNGQKIPVNGKVNGLLSASTGKRSNRSSLRRSYVSGREISDDLRLGSLAYNPRPASMAFSSAALQKNWMGNSPNKGEMGMPPVDSIE